MLVLFLHARGIGPCEDRNASPAAFDFARGKVDQARMSEDRVGFGFTRAREPIGADIGFRHHFGIRARRYVHVAVRPDGRARHADIARRPDVRIFMRTHDHVGHQLGQRHGPAHVPRQTVGEVIVRAHRDIDVAGIVHRIGRCRKLRDRNARPDVDKRIALDLRARHQCRAVHATEAAGHAVEIDGAFRNVVDRGDVDGLGAQVEPDIQLAVALNLVDLARGAVTDKRDFDAIRIALELDLAVRRDVDVGRVERRTVEPQLGRQVHRQAVLGGIDRHDPAATGNRIAEQVTVAPGTRGEGARDRRFGHEKDVEGRRTVVDAAGERCAETNEARRDALGQIFEVGLVARFEPRIATDLELREPEIGGHRAFVAGQRVRPVQAPPGDGGGGCIRRHRRIRRARHVVGRQNRDVAHFEVDGLPEDRRLGIAPRDGVIQPGGSGPADKAERTRHHIAGVDRTNRQIAAVDADVAQVDIDDRTVLGRRRRAADADGARGDEVHLRIGFAEPARFDHDGLGFELWRRARAAEVDADLAFPLRASDRDADTDGTSDTGGHLGLCDARFLRLDGQRVGQNIRVAADVDADGAADAHIDDTHRRGDGTARPGNRLGRPVVHIGQRPDADITPARVDCDVGAKVRDDRSATTDDCDTVGCRNRTPRRAAC